MARLCERGVAYCMLFGVLASAPALAQTGGYAYRRAITVAGAAVPST